IAGKGDVLEPFGQRPQIVGQRLRTFQIKVDKDQTFPSLAADGGKAALFLVDIAEAGFVRDIDEIPCPVEHPGVIGTGKLAPAAFLVPDELHPAMRTYIVKGADLTIL